MNWRTVSLIEVAQFDPPMPKNGALPPDEVVNFLPMSGLSSDSVVVEPTERRKASEVVAGFTYFNTGDVLVAKITPCFENGKAAEIRTSSPHAFGSTEFHVIRADHSQLLPRYLIHFLRQAWVRKAGERRMTGSAGQRRVPRSFLQELTIPIPPLKEQQRIAAILDKADALRQKRRLALQKLDSLVQSVFLDMFGDPVANPHRYPIVALGDVIHSASDGPHVSPQYSDSGIPFLSTRNIRAGGVIWQDLKYISQDDAEIQWRKCRPRKGDILYTKGGTTGLAATVDFDEPIAIWVHVALLRPNIEKVDPYWLEVMLNSAHCYAQSQRYTHGIANRDLGLTRMTRISFYLPPLECQRRFVRAYLKIKDVASQSDTSLKDLEKGFWSLQNRAFRGEL